MRIDIWRCTLLASVLQTDPSIHMLSPQTLESSLVCASESLEQIQGDWASWLSVGPSTRELKQWEPDKIGLKKLESSLCRLRTDMA